MRYQDRHGNKIIEGIYLQLEDGNIELVYACQTGDKSDLRTNVSNEVYLQAHGLGESSQELYPFSEFDLPEVEVYEPELELRRPNMMKQNIRSGNMNLYLAACTVLAGGVGLGYP